MSSLKTNTPINTLDDMESFIKSIGMPSKRRTNPPIAKFQGKAPIIRKPNWLDANGNAVVKLIGIMVVSFAVLMGCAKLMQ